MKKHLRRLSALLCALTLCLTNAFALSVDEALELLEKYYVYELPAAAYEAQTLDELYDIVGDPYTYYMDAAAYERFNAGIESETSVVGIGVSIRFTEEGILILDVIDGGGAKDAGIRAGDVIIAVDGESCVPGLEQQTSKISGEIGTYVDITVRRDDGTVQTLSVERRLIELHNTSISMEDGVGYIECNSFGSRTAEYFSDGIKQYGDEARLWVVDLRGNGGGYASAAVNAAGTFSGSGTKLYLIDRSRYGSPYTCYGEDLTDSPAIVLVNGNTASASEILSGAIRAEQTGIIVGTRTYGKGLAQRVFDSDAYPDMFDGDAFKISTDRFYCSDGNTTDKIGVVPTLRVDDQYTGAVAKLLCAKAPASGEYLTLALNGNEFTVDPAAAKAEDYGDALTALLSALPPDAAVTLTADGKTAPITPAEALARYGNASASRSFTDLAASPYATQIDTLGTYGILLGSGDGQFHPSETLTRAELCAMLAQALNFTSAGTKAVFSDVPAGRWYTGDVNAIASLGFVLGDGAGAFHPNDSLTQEQFITIMGRLVRFLNFRANAFAEDLSMEELLSNRALTAFAPWSHASANVLTAYSGNMLYADVGSIAPKTPVTREQAAATLCNILKTLGILSY